MFVSSPLPRHQTVEFRDPLIQQLKYGQAAPQGLASPSGTTTA
jgi:hypothetical protein